MSSVTGRFKTTGMHCPSCSMVIQMDLNDLPGVTSASADHRTGMTEVVYDDSLVTPGQVVAAITKAGYGAEPIED